MLRLSDLKRPLDHPESALSDAILARLGIGADELADYTVAKRYPARNSSSGAKSCASAARNAAM